jgi:hypothetical protein
MICSAPAQPAGQPETISRPTYSIDGGIGHPSAEESARVVALDAPERALAAQAEAAMPPPPSAAMPTSKRASGSILVSGEQLGFLRKRSGALGWWAKCAEYIEQASGLCAERTLADIFRRALL